MIRLRKIKKSYARPGAEPLTVLNGIDLDIESGVLTAILGASGSGKTTLMNILGLLDRADSGDYFLDGTAVSQQTPNELASLRNRKIGFVFQQFHLLPRTSALENVQLPLIYSNLDRPEQRAVEALCRVGLEDRLTHCPQELSGGQQQRVAIARALVTEPRWILADEPTGNLDQAASEGILELFHDLMSAGRTVILITHDHELARRAARVVCLDSGRLAEVTTLRPEGMPRPSLVADATGHESRRG